MSWTLADIRTFVRQLSVKLTENELTTTELDGIINNNYRFVFPAKTKLDTLWTYYTFYTLPQVQTYDYPDGYVNFKAPFYVNGGVMQMSTDPDVYRYQWMTNVTNQVLAVGDGATTAFSQSATNFNLYPTSLIVSDGVEYFTDDGEGVLTGSAGGTGSVNYLDGSFNVTFAVAPTSVTNILMSYAQYQAGMPYYILMYNNQFSLYPIPDTNYKVSMQAYKVPTALTTSSQTPVLEEWGPLIGYLAAKEIFIRQGAPERAMEMERYFQDALIDADQRTYTNMINVRAIPRV